LGCGGTRCRERRGSDERPQNVFFDLRPAAELGAFAAPIIEELEEATLTSGFLPETYGYTTKLNDLSPEPDFAARREASMHKVKYTLA